MTARTQRRVVRWNTKLEPLSTRVILPRSNGPRIRSRVGTRVVRAGRASRRASGMTMASAASAMEILPAIRWPWRYKGGDGGEMAESTEGDSASRSYPQDRLGRWVVQGCYGGD